MNRFEKVLIYFHSGTGNALLTSQWIASESESLGVPAKIYSIDNNFIPEAPDFTPNTLIYFVYPTHGFNASPAMLKFVRRFPKAKGASFFLANTRAGGKFFKLFTPGVNGLALWAPMFMLLSKGMRFAGMKSVDMPSNWISIHPALPKKWTKEISERWENKTREFTRKALSGIKVYGRALADLPIDIFLFPISIMYYFVGRFALAKTFVYNSKCDGCGVCAENCPVGAIKLNKAGKPYWRFKCESCMRCMNICPKKAIESSHLLFGIYVAMSGLIPANLILNYAGLPHTFALEAAQYAANCALKLSIVFIIYQVCSKALKNSIWNKIVEKTSLTNYWSRYLAPGLKLKDFRSHKH